MLNNLSDKQKTKLVLEIQKRIADSPDPLLEEGLRDQLKNIAKAGGVAALMALSTLKGAAQSGDVPVSRDVARSEVLSLAPRLKLKNNMIDISDHMQEWAPEEWNRFKSSSGFKKMGGKMQVDLDRFKEAGAWARLSEEMQGAILAAVLDRAVELNLRSTVMPEGGEVIARIQYDFKSYKAAKELPTKKYKLQMQYTSKGKKPVVDPEFEKAFREATKAGKTNFTYKGKDYVVKLAKGSDAEKGFIDVVLDDVQAVEIP